MEKSSELLKECTEKIKVSSAEIVVHGTREKPYYEIKYHDLSDGQTHVGYSSYNLDFVFEWLEECFEIINQSDDTIEALSSKLQAANMENNGGWISCEDKLPEINHFYAVTIFDGEDCRVEPAYYAKIGYLGMRELKPNWWTDCTSNAEMIEDGEDKVIAWQPLPEPYRP